MEREFEKEIEDLANGVREEIFLEKEEFMRFREAWLVSEYKDEIVGEAGNNGVTTYRKQKVKNI